MSPTRKSTLPGSLIFTHAIMSWLTRRNSNLSMTEPGRSGVSPTLSTRTFRSIWAMMISRCLSSISTRCDAVHVLDFANQVVLDRFFARDPQDVVRHQRAVDQRVARPDEVAGVDPQVLAVRHQVLALDAAFAADDDGPLAAPLFAQQLDGAVDLGDNRRFLGLAGFEDFRHSRQAAGDVLRAAHFARGLGQQGSGRDHLPSVTSMRAFSGMYSKSSVLPLGVDHDHLRVQIALVLDDHPAQVAAGVVLEPHRLAFDDVFVADLAADLGQDRDVVRVPLAEHRAAFDDRLAVVDQHDGAVGNVVLLELAPLAIQELKFAVAGERDRLPSSLMHDL